MLRVHTPIIRSIRCSVAAYGFLHRVFGWVVVLRAAVYGADGAGQNPLFRVLFPLCDRKEILSVALYHIHQRV